jgi:uncharacterized membrane protein YhaH (DUF805 family)
LSRKAFLASVAFVFVPLYALGYFLRLHLFVDSVKQTARNLFNTSGTENRASYLLWTIAVAILITTIEAFELFPTVLPKLTAAREKLGFRETNWNQFFSGHSRFSHVLVWLLMTSATIRRMRSTGFSTWILAPFFCMALSIDVNDILAYADIAKTSNTYANTFIDVVRDVATIGYGVTFTAGVVVFLFVIPEENEVGCTKGQMKSAWKCRLSTCFSLTVHVAGCSRRERPSAHCTSPRFSIRSIFCRGLNPPDHRQHHPAFGQGQ